MGKKKKNKHKPHSVESNSKYSPVQFELEENAEELFMDAMKNLGSGSLVDKDRESNIEKQRDLKSPPRGRLEGKSSTSIDLHGCTLNEAQSKIDSFILQLLRTPGQTHNIRIVTGKGIHSEKTRGVLASEIHGYVVSRFKKHIVRIQESPHEVKVGGVPIRGHFDLTLQT